MSARWSRKCRPTFVKENAAFADGFVAVPLEVLVRFGRWDEILAEPDNYPESMLFSRAFHHAARAIALRGQGRHSRTRARSRPFSWKRAKLVPKETPLGNNTAGVGSLARHPHARRRNPGRGKEAGRAAWPSCRPAVKEEDALKYDEPPAWMIPVRHSLGAVLMKARRFAEAEQVYRDDLARLPDNGWSLFGLAESLREQKKNDDEAAATKAKFQKSWAKADMKITTSCLCQARK